MVSNLQPCYGLGTEQSPSVEFFHTPFHDWGSAPFKTRRGELNLIIYLHERSCDWFDILEMYRVWRMIAYKPVKWIITGVEMDNKPFALTPRGECGIAYHL